MGTYEISREIVVNSTIEKIKDTLIDFKQWKLWSPWLILEPQTKLSYGGIKGTIDSSYSWDGAMIGSGKMVLENIEHSLLECRLEFYKPWKSNAKVTYRLQEETQGVRVRWTMQSSLPWFMFFMKKRMMAWIGMDFDRGLLMLKEYIEQGNLSATSVYEGIHNVSSFYYIGIQNSCRHEQLIPPQKSRQFQK